MRVVVVHTCSMLSKRLRMHLMAANLLVFTLCAFRTSEKVPSPFLATRRYFCMAVHPSRCWCRWRRAHCGPHTASRGLFGAKVCSPHLKCRRQGSQLRSLSPLLSGSPQSILAHYLPPEMPACGGDLPQEAQSLHPCRPDLRCSMLNKATAHLTMSLAKKKMQRPWLWLVSMHTAQYDFEVTPTHASPPGRMADPNPCKIKRRVVFILTFCVVCIGK